MQVTKDIVFGAADGRELHLDVYQPGGERLGTAVLLLHGGGWRMGSKDRMEQHARVLVEAGFTGIASEYRLTLEARWPAQIHDTRRAIRWVRSEAASLGIDPDRICLQGHSAGAHLALLAAGTPHDASYDAPNDSAEVSAAVAAVAAVYPPTLFHASGERPSGALPGRVLLGEDATDADAAWASPLAQVSSDFPPTMLIHGDADEVVPFSASLRMQERLKEAGVPVDAQYFAGLPHGFANLPEIIPGLESMIALFFRRTVAQPTLIAESRARMQAAVAAAEAAAAR